MTTPKRPRDPNQLAKFIVDVATREVEDREPEPADEAARKRGSFGGVVCARNLTAEKRREIAEKGTTSRWKRDRPVQETKE